jgi:hypothetical protein
MLDRGVLFYAAIGNHDRELEQHFKPFHMTSAVAVSRHRFRFLNSSVVIGAFCSMAISVTAWQISP